MQTNRFKIITLCGSTKFKDEFIRLEKEFTLKGCIVLKPSIYGHVDSPEAFEPKTQEMLKNMHMRKIKMADEVFVVNKNGYIGESTKNEIDYAHSLFKPVKYLEKVDTPEVKFYDGFMNFVLGFK